MSNSQNELIVSERTDGTCAICSGRRKSLTEVSVDLGDQAVGFVQVCDKCREAAIEGLQR